MQIAYKMHFKPIRTYRSLIRAYAQMAMPTARIASYRLPESNRFAARLIILPAEFGE
jgi:hypothetical protein